MTYNGINVPPLIRTDLIISAFENCIDLDKVEEYANIMRNEGLSHDFPPISGYPFVISEEDAEGEIESLSGTILSEFVGYTAWKVTDGHHRTLAAIRAELPHLEVMLDYSCITDTKELIQFNH